MQVLYLNGKWTKLKYLLPLLACLLPLSADVITVKTLACPSVTILQKFVKEDLKDPLKLDIYAISNNCIILSKGDKVEALGYDPRNSKEVYQKILYKKTNRELYMRRSSIFVEQGGKKNSIRF
jgi:hypothetical protein